MPQEVTPTVKESVCERGQDHLGISVNIILMLWSLRFHKSLIEMLKALI